MKQANHKYKIPSDLRAIWKPPDEITVPDWVEKNIRLSGKSCPEPGPLRISRTPYTRGPLLALGSPFIDWVVLCFGRQTGKTEGILIPYICYCIAQDPGPTVYFLPIQEKCKEVEAQKMAPMLELCEAVQKQRTENPDDYSNLRKVFKTMIFSMAWGGSASQATTRSTRYLFRDEIDEQGKSIGPDGIDPMRGIEQTTSNFSNRKIIDASTPTTSEGNIWQELKRCQYIFEYWIPCSHCGVFQILYWENVKFGDNHDPEIVENIAWYECESCKEKISNLDKCLMLNSGEWRARLSDDPCNEIMKNIRAQIENTISFKDVLKNRRIKKIGFHLPKWYSTFSGGSFGTIAKDFLEANKAFNEGEDFTPMRNWRKFNAALPWAEEAISKSEIELMGNRIDLPPKICPKNTITLTCGIDPSEGINFWVVLAWVPIPEYRGFSGHLVDYGIAPNFNENELEMFLVNMSYPIKETTHNGRIMLSGLDTGGSEYEAADTTMTEAAYLWLARMRQKGINVIGTKGSSHPMKQRAKMTKIEKMPGPKGKPIAGGLILWEINTIAMKDVLWYHLQIEDGKPGRFTFNSGTDMDYIKHLLSERKVMQKNGQWEWIRKGRNHWLDATLIAMTLVENDCYGLQLMTRSVTRKSVIISKGVER